MRPKPAPAPPARPIPLKPSRFSPRLLEEFTEVVLKWTRKHHPERLRGEDSDK